MCPDAGMEAYLPLVAAIARTVSRGLPPSVELDELINDGMIGLIGALRRYDPARGVGFATYAGHRVRGAMLDGLRQRDPLPRAVRRLRKAAGRGLAPSSEAIQLVDLDQAAALAADERTCPEAITIERDLRRRLQAALETLPPRDRRVLVLRMIRGLTLRAAAAHLSLSITRTAEIQARGLARLRRHLTGEPAGRPPRPRAAEETGASLWERQEKRARPPNTPATPDRSHFIAHVLPTRPGAGTGEAV